MEDKNTLKKINNVQLERSQFVSFSTRKKNGTTVETPVWFAKQDNNIYIFSAGNSGKIKRLRNFSETRVAPCDVRGKLKGEWVGTKARILESQQEMDKAYQALVSKYGWQLKLIDFFSRISGKIEKRAFIEAVILSTA